MSPRKERMDCFVALLLAMTAHIRTLATRNARVGHEPRALEHQRAQGMPGAGCARSLVCKMKKHTSIVTTVTPKFTRHSLHNGFNGFLRALLGEPGLFATVAQRILPRSLTPASGRQDHTTSPSASCAARLAAPLASTASRPASVTIASRPSVGRDRIAILLFLPKGQARFRKIRNCDPCDWWLQSRFVGLGRLARPSHADCVCDDRETSLRGVVVQSMTNSVSPGVSSGKRRRGISSISKSERAVVTNT
jgi:hypothetical protein